MLDGVSSLLSSDWSDSLSKNLIGPLSLSSGPEGKMKWSIR